MTGKVLPKQNLSPAQASTVDSQLSPQIVLIIGYWIRCSRLFWLSRFSTFFEAKVGETVFIRQAVSTVRGDCWIIQEGNEFNEPFWLKIYSGLTHCLIRYLEVLLSGHHLKLLSALLPLFISLSRPYKTLVNSTFWQLYSRICSH